MWESFVFRGFRSRKPKNLEDELSNTDAKLALLNAELAAQMVKLAGQTEDLGPLAQAEDGIRDPLWSRGLGDVYKRQI